MEDKMTVWIKQGVLGDLSPEVRRAKGKLTRQYRSDGLDFFITSKREGNHREDSCHYEGCGLDFKRQGKTKREILIFLDYDSDFDIVEYEDLDIFHVEYDPK